MRGFLCKLSQRKSRVREHAEQGTEACYVSSKIKREGEVTVAIVLIAIVLFMLIGGVMNGDVPERTSWWTIINDVVAIGLLLGIGIYILITRINEKSDSVLCKSRIPVPSSISDA